MSYDERINEQNRIRTRANYERSLRLEREARARAQKEEEERLQRIATLKAQEELAKTQLAELTEKQNGQDAIESQ